MKNIFQNLNGWQRLFIVLTIAIQVPFTILIASELPTINPTAKILNEKLQPIVVAEKISQPLTINDEVSLNSAVNKENDKLIEMYKESERRGMGKLVTFSASNHFSMPYYVFLDNRMSDAEQIKIGTLIQQLIDSEFSNSKLKNYVLTFAYSIFIALAIYVLGMAIGWVIKGFRKE